MQRHHRDTTDTHQKPLPCRRQVRLPSARLAGSLVALAKPFGLHGWAFSSATELLRSTKVFIASCLFSALLCSTTPCPPCPRHIGAAPGRRTVSLGPMQHCQSEPLSFDPNSPSKRLPARPLRHLQVPPSCGSSFYTECTIYELHVLSYTPSITSTEFTTKAPYGEALKC